MYSMLLKNGLLPLADWVMNTTVSSSCNQIKHMWSLSNTEIEEWQRVQLTRLVNHAYKNTKYYNRLFDRIGIQPKDIQTKDDLKALPILTKKDIREHFEDIKANNINSIPHKISSSGGSTGDPLVFLLDKKSWSYSNAETIVHWERTGYNYGDKYIALGSTSLFPTEKSSYKHMIYYGLKNKIGLNGINMSDDICNEYIKLIIKRRIRFIYGYASSIYLLANYAFAHKIDLNIVACFPTSERLTDAYRNTILKAFNCQIVDCYGAHDGGVTAFAHNYGYYEVGYNCLIRQDRVDKNYVGSALLTDLLNYSMPLINYQIGDELQIRENNYHKYSYNGQIINKVFGRSSEIIRLENGNVLTGPGFTILFKDLPVEHYLIEKSGLNSIRCTIKRLPSYNRSHENIIISTFQKQMGHNTKFDIVYSEYIELTKSGKRKYFKSDIE